jgi:tyrosyl-tRNA synthetase
MFGKLMSIPDGAPEDDGHLTHRFGVLCHYHQALLEWPLPRCEALEADLEAGRLHPKAAKAEMARQVVTQYHSAEAAEGAAAEFERVFADRQLPTDMPEITLPADIVEADGVDPVRLVRLCGFASSNGEVRRLIDQGGIRIDDALVVNFEQRVPLADGAVLRVGKRRFARLRLGT